MYLLYICNGAKAFFVFRPLVSKSDLEPLQHLRSEMEIFKTIGNGWKQTTVAENSVFDVEEVLDLNASLALNVFPKGHKHRPTV